MTREKQFDACPFCGCEEIKAGAFSISGDCYVTCTECGAMIETEVSWKGVNSQAEHDEACRTALLPLWNRRSLAGAAALSGWVRTAERLPEGGEMELVQGAYQHREWGFMLHEIIAIGWLKSHPEMYPYWMPLPPLPESAGVEGTKTEGDE